MTTPRDVGRDAGVLQRRRPPSRGRSRPGRRAGRSAAGTPQTAASTGRRDRRLGAAAPDRRLERAAAGAARARAPARSTPSRGGAPGPRRRSSSASSPKRTRTSTSGASSSASSSCSTIAVGGQLDAGGSTRGLPSTVSRASPPFARTSSASRWVRVGCGRRRRLRGVVAQHADHRAHLLERAPALALDVPERGRRGRPRSAGARPRRPFGRARPGGAGAARRARRRCARGRWRPPGGRARRARRAAPPCALRARPPCRLRERTMRPMPHMAAVRPPKATAFSGPNSTAAVDAGSARATSAEARRGASRRSSCAPAANANRKAVGKTTPQRTRSVPTSTSLSSSAGERRADRARAARRAATAAAR